MSSFLQGFPGAGWVVLELSMPCGTAWWRFLTLMLREEQGYRAALPPLPPAGPN